MNDFTAWDAGLHRPGGDPDALEHYGVLGMKWGMRRYQNKDGSLTAAGERHYEKTGEKGYHYHSHATKKYAKKAAKTMKKAEAYDVGARVASSHGRNATAQKHAAKADKLAAKAKKYLNRAKRSAEIDKGEEEYARKLSTGKAIVGTLLTSGNTMKGYAQYRAMSGQTGKGLTGQKIVSGIKAYRSGAYGSRIAKAAYIRQGEKKGLGQKAYGLQKEIGNRAAAATDDALAIIRRVKKKAGRR